MTSQQIRALSSLAEPDCTIPRKLLPRASKVEVGSIRQIRDRLNAEGILVSESAIRHWVKAGLVPAVLCGNRAYVSYENVRAYLQADWEIQEPPATLGIRKIR